MVEFRTMYYGPMDRQDVPISSEAEQESALEQPIFPINQLGETVPEALGGRNVIQTTQAAIRGGAGTLQLVLNAPQDSIGPTSIAARAGKEVRQALREVALANEVKIVSAEMPTHIRNLSGFDVQNEKFSEEQRKRSLDAVKDTIKFIGDVNGGGGVDLVSWEFSRSVNDANWNKDQNFKFKRDNEAEKRTLLVHSRTGTTTQVSKDDPIHAPVNKNTWERSVDQEVISLNWSDLQKWAEHNKQQNQKKHLEKGHKEFEPETPEEVWVKIKIDEQIDSLKGNAASNIRIAKQEEYVLKQHENNLKAETDEKEKERTKKEIQRLKESIVNLKRSANSSIQQAEEAEDRRQQFIPIGRFGLKKSAQTYAEAGIFAMKETKEGMERKTVSKPIHVGPEMGWPDWYGSHPDEFMNVIRESRKEMVNMLTQPVIEDAAGNKIKSQFFNPKITHKQAEELAAQHIKGCLDTSHMGMWIKHFESKPGETEEQKIERFNKWFKNKAEEMAKTDLIGGIQLVDSGSGEHGHLPPGEGIFPVIETAQIFKKHGFGGFLVSEGHEEERFGSGRIRTKLWQKAGKRLHDHGYFAGAGPSFPGQTSGYFGKTYSPLFMFGSYSPNLEEFKLWSQVPLE